MKIFTHTPTSEALLDEIRAALPEYIGEKRLNHTFFVEKEALALAESVFLVYNIENEYRTDLQAAALLHDITKELPLEKQLKLCRRYGIAPGEYPSCAVLHGQTAAHLARERFHVNDAVFSAVFCHTTGKADMNVFDKIIFLADYIEPSRVHEHCKQTRSTFYGGLQKCGPAQSAELLDEAVLLCLDGTLSHLLTQKSIIDRQTVEARNYLIGRRTGVPAFKKG